MLHEGELGEVLVPPHRGERRLGLRAGGVQHQDVDRSERTSTSAASPSLPLVGDVGRERLRCTAVLRMSAATAAAPTSSRRR